MPVFVAAVKRSRSRRRNCFGAPAQLDSCACCDYLTRRPHTAGESGLIKKISYSSFGRGTNNNLGVSTRPPPVLEGSPRPLTKMEGEFRRSPVDETPLSPTSPSNLSPNNGGHPLLPSGVEKSFKTRRTFSSRRRDVEEIVKKHPHKIPIIVERSKNEKVLGLLDKSKFLVPEELTMSQLNAIIRRRLQLSDTQAFYLIINRRSMASASMTLSEIYRTEKDDDGFLYITYASQEMFG